MENFVAFPIQKIQKKICAKNLISTQVIFKKACTSKLQMFTKVKSSVLDLALLMPSDCIILMHQSANN